jgi:hypothetical protein
MQERHALPRARRAAPRQFVPHVPDNRSLGAVYITLGLKIAPCLSKNQSERESTHYFTRAMHLLRGIIMINALTLTKRLPALVG